MNRESKGAGASASWKVLVVDDEPAVHEVSRLVLAGTRFEGGEVELLSADSAAQAREILMRHDDIALALLDVVMETDDAGIALVQHIRSNLGDSDMQIVLRTGQPGMAPEGDVVVQYEINGYFLKTELTAQRLHSIVISGLRGYRLARSLRSAAEQARAGTDLRRPDAADSALAGELADPSRGAMPWVWQFRPEISLATNQVAGVELVPEWRSAIGLHGLERIDAAVGPGAVRQRIACTLVEQACRYAAQWRGQRRVSVPLFDDSPQGLEGADGLLAIVREAALPAGALDFLIGDAALRTASPQAGIVAQLRALGVSLTLAGFGAHAMSLRRLGELAPDRVKLHRHFVQGVADDPERALLARSLIALAHTLNIVAIADGVASDSDAQFFKWEGCEFGQGDALAPACAPADIVALLAHGRVGLH